MRARDATLLGLLLGLAESAAYTAGACSACLSAHRQVIRPSSRLAVAMREEGDDDAPEPEWTGEGIDSGEAAGINSLPWRRELETLAERLISVKRDYELEQRFEALPSAWVLVFDAETEDEAVYSMQIEGESSADESHVVLAFEDMRDAERYALSLTDEPYAAPPAAQELDFEALVVTSRDAEFGVAVVFKGDLGEQTTLDEREVPIFASDAASALSVSITMVPENLFSDKSASDYIDPAEDPIWVLVHDAGTADAQYFSMMLNGSDSIVCFRDEAAASRCGEALQSTGVLRGPSTQSVLLEDLLSSLSEERDVCLVDEVVEQLIDSDDDEDELPSLIASDDMDDVVGSVQPSKSSATPNHVLMALERLYAANSTSIDGDLDAPR